MIENPDRYAAAFVRAGANSVSVHYEACRHLDATLGLIRDAGAMAGIVLNPATPVEVLEDVLEVADYVLIMSVNPGFGGQPFIHETLPKVQSLARREDSRRFRIEVDGGINFATAVECARAGADTFVSGTGLFAARNLRACVGVHGRDL